MSILGGQRLKQLVKQNSPANEERLSSWNVFYLFRTNFNYIQLIAVRVYA